MGLLEGFATSMISSNEPVSEEEGFRNRGSEVQSRAFLTVVLTLLFYVAIVLAISFVGALMWNTYLVPAVSVLKKVDTV